MPTLKRERLSGSSQNGTEMMAVEAGINQAADMSDIMSAMLRSLSHVIQHDR